MSPNHQERSWKAVLLDVEGTTTSIRFVYDELFPFARKHVASFLELHWNEPGVQQDVDLIRAQSKQDIQTGVEGGAAIPDGRGQEVREAVLGNILWQMDADRKTTGLKSLQGRIWRDGYESGAILGHVYDDVPEAFYSLEARGVPIFIYSSGSVEAQRLLFANSLYGDLTPKLAGHFDTTTGPKKEAASYRRICDLVGVSPGELLFVTDSLSEANAACEADVGAVISIRPGNPPVGPHPFPEIRSLSELSEPLLPVDA